MICPACNEVMIVVEYKKIELDVCTSCDGIWFDQNELELLLGTYNIKLEGLGTKLGKSSEIHRRCPHCNAKMEKRAIGPANVTIDACPKNHGLWFDKGELEQIINELSGPGNVGGTGRKIGSFLSEALADEGGNQGSGSEEKP